MAGVQIVSTQRTSRAEPPISSFLRTPASALGIPGPLPENRRSGGSFITDFAAALAVFRAEQIAEDGEEPRGHVCSRLERIDIGQGFLHKVVRAVDVAAE